MSNLKFKSTLLALVGIILHLTAPVIWGDEGTVQSNSYIVSSSSQGQAVNEVTTLDHLLGVGNYEGTAQEGESSFTWYRNDDVYRSGKSRTIFDAATNDTNHFDDIGNHDGMPPVLNCQAAQEGDCLLELGFDADKSNACESCNNAEYNVKLAGIHGTPLDIREFSFIGFWVFIEDPELLASDRAFRMYITSNETWYNRPNKRWNWSREKLVPGWNYLIADIDKPDQDVYDEGQACLLEEIRFLIITFYPHDESKDIPQGDLKLDEIKLWSESPLIKMGELTAGDHWRFRYTPCRQDGVCGNDSEASVDISSSDPILLKSPRIKEPIYPSSQVTCYVQDEILGQSVYYDGDGDAWTGTDYTWWLNGQQLAGQTGETLAGDSAGIKPGDSLSCSVQVQNINGNSQWYQSNQVTVSKNASILVNANEIVKPISPYIFGQGLNMVPEAINRAISWDGTGIVKDRRDVSKEIGFTSVRWGGGGGNYFMWDRCRDQINGESYYRYRSDKGKFDPEDCSITPGLSGMFAYSEDIGADENILTVNLTNNGGEAWPTVRPEPSYSKGFVDYVNNW